MPRRLRKRKQRKKPEGVIMVGGNSSWSNPFKFSEGHIWYDAKHYIANESEWFKYAEAEESHVKSILVRLFRDWFFGMLEPYPPGLPQPRHTVKDVKEKLRGSDLMCECKIKDPCHGDLLLEIANR